MIARKKVAVIDPKNLVANQLRGNHESINDEKKMVSEKERKRRVYELHQNKREEIYIEKFSCK